MKKHKVFIDANVIVHWILFQSLLKEKKTPKERQDFLNQHKNNSIERTRRIYESYSFIENKVINKQKNFVFISCNLVLTEVFNALFEEYMLSYMKRNFIPLSTQYEVRKELFPDGTLQQIYFEHKDSIDKFSKSTKIVYEKDSNVINFSAAFISEYGLQSQDAHILAQAVNSDCEYIITNDTDFLEKFKQSNPFKILALKPSSFQNHFSKILLTKEKVISKKAKR